MPPTTNPYLVALYVAGVFVLVPVLRLVWNMAVFFVKAITKLDQIDGIATDVATMKHDKANESHSLELSLSIIESDVNDLQRHNNLPVREFPDRRTSGVADRRGAA